MVKDKENDVTEPRKHSLFGRCWGRLFKKGTAESSEEKDGNQDPVKMTDLLDPMNDDPLPLTKESSRRYITTRRKILAMCEVLASETKTFEPGKLVEDIEKYLQISERVDRILYSEINAFLLNLDEKARGAFQTNVEHLLLYSLKEQNNVGQDCRKIIIKFYDHSQLVFHQVVYINTNIDTQINATIDQVQKDVQGMEKDYISILGIFSSVVLAFIGGMTFSTSVLQNIHDVSIYRLILIVDMLGFILVNTIYLMLKFILFINVDEKDIPFFKIKHINIAFAAIAILVIIAWALSLGNFQTWFAERFHWLQ